MMKKNNNSKSKIRILNIVLKRIKRNIKYVPKTIQTIDNKDNENNNDKYEISKAERIIKSSLKDTNNIVNKIGINETKRTINNIKDIKNTISGYKANNYSDNYSNIKIKEKQSFKTPIKTREYYQKIQYNTKDKYTQIKNRRNTIKIKSYRNTINPNKSIIIKEVNDANKRKQNAKQVMTKIKKITAKNIKIIKKLIRGIREFISFFIAGGWIILVLLIVICIISFMMTSIFGIFFSGDISENSNTISSVMAELNNDFINKLNQIQLEVPHDEFDIEGSRAIWKDIIAVFIVKYSDGDYRQELLFLDDNRINQFKEVFWYMNEITYTTEENVSIYEIQLSNGKTETIEEVTTKLHIKINGKTINDIKNELSEKQIIMLNEIMKDDYIDLWNNLLKASSNGSTDIVEFAKTQLGQVGGYPYWSWYGFSSRVSWCACFVSYCANECGYIEQGIIPKFAACESEGVSWFKTCNLWQDNSYIPNPRRYNIF